MQKYVYNGRKATRGEMQVGDIVSDIEPGGLMAPELFKVARIDETRLYLEWLGHYDSETQTVDASGRTWYRAENDGTYVFINDAAFDPFLSVDLA